MSGSMRLQGTSGHRISGRASSMTPSAYAEDKTSRVYRCSKAAPRSAMDCHTLPLRKWHRPLSCDKTAGEGSPTTPVAAKIRLQLQDVDTRTNGHEPTRQPRCQAPQVHQQQPRPPHRQNQGQTDGERPQQRITQSSIVPQPTLLQECQVVLDHVSEPAWPTAETIHRSGHASKE
eukprot:CAMPEP_0194545708 /NCGR_PEP_ID=MMETSP0253-20130528/89584_1 /TAXON_ID=2966 /ORGANISM="Noctiluca scintillans" /LENGTH=174 /DNA_ID=CAMNT_0039392731 /DNA_START=710 /DNA_END=1233 /DNA_ORIENTATION=+